MPRDLYDLLGVSKSAADEEIRKAYLLRTRVVHPDRFNRAQQSAEWLQANDMLRELNGAYEVLSDPARRAHYDASLTEAQSRPRPRAAREPTHAGSESSSSPPPEDASDPKDGTVERFLQLCRYIWLTCWQQIQTGPSDRSARLLVLRAACADYKRRASPWLSIILENYRGNTPVIAQARNAAASCLSSLAGGFIGVDDLDRAQTLAGEALVLIFDDEKLEAKVKGQLDYVTSEKQKSEPQPGRSNREPLGEARSSADINQEVGPRPARVAGPLFSQLGNPRIRVRLAQILVVGIGALGAILSLTKSNGPQRSALTPPPKESFARSTPAPADFKRLMLDGQLETLERANPQEKQQLTPIFRERFKRDIGKVPEEEQELFFRRMAAAELPDFGGVEPSPAQQSQEPPATAQTPFPHREQDGGSQSVAGSTKPTAKVDSSDLAKYGSSLYKAPPSPTPNLRNPVSSPPSEATLPPPRAIDPCNGPPSAQEQHRPSNGYESDYDRTVKGNGELTVVNGNSEDAAVILSNSAVETPDRLFYVRAGMEAKITEIPPGRYRVMFQTGKKWDSESERFQCVLATKIFDRGEAFEEQRTETDVQYSHIRLTLHKVVGGNARTAPLDPSAFQRRRRIH